ncbi:CHAD domain-containing protein [Leptothermofonsia sp. ETS-13]|uniref:CHAD domain-containing protein n=1 Tax=Leptothermofonsia sp. ETS-13 TaxID=3035696 RepID=UPI003B9E6BB9
MALKIEKKVSPKSTFENYQSLTLGDFAYKVISAQYQLMTKLEKKVLADKDPEHLHDMRVASRRLRTALQVFGIAVELPKAAQAKRIGAIAKILGNLRDLDVQIADLREVYRPRAGKAEQALLDEAITALQQERRKAFAAVEVTLSRSSYQELKTAYEIWLSEPRYTTLAQLPLLPLLPDLLSPLLSSLLLHPGWLIQSSDLSEEANQTLHDLRKACKGTRYQSEFFVSLYGKPFKEWIGELKGIQDCLGKVQDGQVLVELLAKHLPNRAKLPKLQASVRQCQVEMMANWEPIRQKYLDSAFRKHLHEMLLEPESSPALVG